MTGAAAPLRTTAKLQSDPSSNLDQGQLLRVGAGARLELDVGVVGLLDHVQGELLVQALVVVAELVGGLAVRDLVVTEPLQDLLDLTREVPVSQK